jgi:predicted phosphoribosyltransferase
MPSPFRNREAAGRALAECLGHYGLRPNLVVLGLPRGGVPVAAEVARALGAPLDVLVVRKLGVPRYPELAMGAIAQGGLRVLNREVIDVFGVSERELQGVIQKETAELERRVAAYRGNRPFPDLHGATVILVDDGVATGSTMVAAISALRSLGPSCIIAAAPVMSREARAALSRVADHCEFVMEPEPFYGVGAWYRDFTQTTDEEVHALLAAPEDASHA